MACPWHGPSASTKVAPPVVVHHEHHMVIDHGDEQQWAEWLAACRRAILAEFPEGHPFYEEWLMVTVPDPSSIPALVRAYTARMKRWRAVADQLAHALDNIGDCDCDLLAPEHDHDCPLGAALDAYTALSGEELTRVNGGNGPEAG